MAVTDAFRNDVSAGDVRGIRIMMKDSLLGDPTFIEFNDMSNLARNVSGLYDEHDGRELISDRSVWNDDYMNKLMVQVIRNFSHERLDHLKEVVKYLRPVSVGTRQIPPNRTYPRNRRDNSSRGVKIAFGAGGGAVAGGVIAGISGGSVFIGALVGAVIVGGIAVFVTKEE